MHGAAHHLGALDAPRSTVMLRSERRPLDLRAGPRPDAPDLSKLDAIETGRRVRELASRGLTDQSIALATGLDLIDVRRVLAS